MMEPPISALQFVNIIQMSFWVPQVRHERERESGAKYSHRTLLTGYVDDGRAECLRTVFNKKMSLKTGEERAMTRG